METICVFKVSFVYLTSTMKRKEAFNINLKQKNTMKKIVLTSVALLLLIGCSKEENIVSPEELQQNLAPLAFNLISPVEGAELDVYDITFEWEPAQDPENDNVTYDLYLYREQSSPVRIAQNLVETSYTLEDRSIFNTAFDWYVVAKDGITRSTDVKTTERSFTTRNVEATQVTDGGAISSFSSRYAYTGVYFNDRFFVMNGFGDGASRGDIWSSTDYGQEWSRQNDLTSTGFERHAHTSVIFNDRLYILGGYNNNRPIGDIYTSTNGIDWSQETESFSPRYEHTSVVFNDKIMVIGGYNDNLFLDDVMTWTGNERDPWETIASGVHTPFDGIRGHSSVVFDDQIWVIGGANRNGYLSEVWVSFDGRNWSQKRDIPMMSAYHKTVVFDNKIWIIGGLTDSGPSNQVYYYDKDTSVWASYEMPEEFRALYDHAVIVVNDRTPEDGIYILGSFDGRTYSNDVWKLY